ncbi:hypothetical protein [Streptoalloteichus hindustanus]|uniref:Uncharacterized protein n=1 Tax=Streptoalloteichus hindustanus TaxID=2017 RepID=A0A1M5F000_STRHI|nr:hypothetical protein [Streptoalloteichus hindustanus]SHF84748.1 hypothetical protein SAMN05444320_105213 [Streptoalloteichus hindustanus]
MRGSRGTGRRHVLAWRGTLVTGVVAALLTGLVQPAAAAEPPVKFTDAQLGDALFATAVQVKNTGVELDKTIITSAELLDWRTKNPNVDAGAIASHLDAVRSAIDKRLSQTKARGPHAEALRGITEIVYDTSGTQITGTWMTELLGVVTGRDLAPGSTVSLTTLGRVYGAQQGLDLNVAFTKFEWGLLAAVRQRAATDPAFAGVWRDKIGAAKPGQPYSVDPTANVAALKSLPVLRDVLKVDALVERGAAGKTAFYQEVRSQVTALRQRYEAVTSPLVDRLRLVSVQEGKPGTTRQPPDAARVEREQKDQETRQHLIDQVKGGADFVVGVVKHFDEGFGNQLAQYTTAAFEIATQVNNLVTAVGQLAATTALGAATLGYVGAAIGAVVGIVQIFAGLFGGRRSNDEAAQQMVVKLLVDGFGEIRANLRTIYKTMNLRFDRIDVALNTIYQTMQSRFDQVVTLIQDTNASIADVHQQLLSLQAAVQAFGERALAGIKDANGQSFAEAVGAYVDFARYNNGKPMSSYETQYFPAVTNFLTTAKHTARNNNYVFKDFRQSDARIAFTSSGTAGAVDWLANYANQHYGTRFDVAAADAMVPNVDLWAEAARAYYLTAVQNPKLAGQEGKDQARAGDIIENGMMVLNHAKQFSAPGGTAGTALFDGLANDYRAKLGAFADAAENLATREPVMQPGRHFQLWGDVNQGLPPGAINGLGMPNTATPCAGSGPSGPKPPFVDGTQLPAPMQLSRQIDAGVQPTVCYTKVYWRTGTLYAPIVTKPDRTDPDTWIYRNVADLVLDVEFHTMVHGEHGRTERATKTYKRGCSWQTKGAPGTEGPCTGDLAASLTDGVKWEAGAASTVANAGAEKARLALSERRARFYELVATVAARDYADPAESHALNNQVRLYQAYVQLGLPRARETDDELHALAFGTHGLIGNSDSSQVLSAIYAQAAQVERATYGRGALPIAMLDDSAGGSSPPDCGTYRGKGRDPVGLCVKDIGADRAKRLHARIGTHLEHVRAGTETQTLPLIDEALANLRLVRQYVRTAHPQPGPQSQPQV